MDQTTWAIAELEKTTIKLRRVAVKNEWKLPYTTDAQGNYDNRADQTVHYEIDNGINWWTNGFWAGILWRLYARTKDPQYLDYARKQEQMLAPCFTQYEGLHHDVGFMFLPSAVADYLLTGDHHAKVTGLHAASLLAGRFNPAGSFIRAWNDLPGSTQDTRGWAIIDCMLNISLLFWASRETKDPRFAQIAMAHADTVMQAFVRADGSCCHIVEFDPESGKRLKSHGGQGFAHGSAWTRGQGWGVYGFANAYRNSGKKSYLETAQKIAEYCLTKIDASYVIPIDFDQPSDCTFEDSCGACVLACGFLTLAKLTKDQHKATCYAETGYRIIRQIAEHRADYSDHCDAIVQNCSASFHNKEHHVTMVYADYYYLEALDLLSGSDFGIW
ncbi:MAG: glycoside hydrolase family 88 protein [Lachnospiraceae bacterium]|nr:glycoside hydrolase family 88 protein [Lachnospiraceae bacterium]